MESEDPAHPPEDPAEPSRAVWLAWATIGALYLGLGVAYGVPYELSEGPELLRRVIHAASFLRILAPHVGLALLAVVAVVVWERRWRLALALLPLLAVFLGPELASLVPRGSGERERGELRVFSANVFANNQHTGADEGILARCLAEDPDVVLLQETTPPWHRAFAAALESTHPHSIGRPTGAFGVSAFSRWPMTAEAFQAGRAQVWLLRLRVQAPRGPVVLYAVHVINPLAYVTAVDQQRQLRELERRLAAEPAGLPLVVAGDFNFTSRCAQGEGLEALGLTDAHDLTGWGRSATWSSGLPVPGLRLDHAYVRGLKVERLRLDEGLGSDHRPLILDLSWPESD